MKGTSDQEIVDRIFNSGNTDIGELLFTLFSPSVKVDTKKLIWKLWSDKYYSFDDVREFFSDSLFNEDGSVTYVDVMLKCENYNNFYELALGLDMNNIDPTMYYIYWILTFGIQTDKKVLEEALEYDPDVILGLFPDIKEVIF